MGGHPFCSKFRKEFLLIKICLVVDTCSQSSSTNFKIDSIYRAGKSPGPFRFWPSVTTLHRENSRLVGFMRARLVLCYVYWGAHQVGSWYITIGLASQELSEFVRNERIHWKMQSFLVEPEIRISVTVRPQVSLREHLVFAAEKTGCSRCLERSVLNVSNIRRTGTGWRKGPALCVSSSLFYSLWPLSVHSKILYFIL